MTNHVARFQAAVSVLAGDGHIKQRLISAFRDNLDEIEDGDLPNGVRKGFKDLRDRMSGVAPHNGEGPISASVRKMSAMEASECAITVVTLYGELLKHPVAAEEVSTTATEDEAQQIPPFLVKSAS